MNLNSLYKILNQHCLCIKYSAKLNFDIFIKVADYNIDFLKLTPARVFCLFYFKTSDEIVKEAKSWPRRIESLSGVEYGIMYVIQR